MRKYRRSISDYIMRDLRLEDEWKRRIERQKRRKENGEGTNKTETRHD